jgi:hypothetical protein
MSALNPVRGGVFNALHELVKERLADRHRSDWMDACTYSGHGSGSRRRRDPPPIRGQRAPDQFGHEARGRGPSLRRSSAS